MKKNFMIALVAVATLSFAACNTKTDGASKTDGDSTSVEVAPADVKSTEEGSALDKYAELVEKMIPLQEKAKSGDAAAIEELTKLGQEVSDIATKLQSELATMTPEQAAKFNELAQKLAGQAAK